MSEMVLAARSVQESLAEADELLRAGRVDEAAAAYAALAGEMPTAPVCLGLARCHEELGETREAYRHALAVVDAGGDFASWQAAAAIARRTVESGDPPRRTARLALLGSYTTNQLATMLWLAALRVGVSLELYESPFGQYRQELLDPSSPAHAFNPELVLVAVHAGELTLPLYSDSPDADVAAEVERWTSLWRSFGERSDATIVQHGFALPPDAPFGHLGATLPGSRQALCQAVNSRLAASAPPNVAFVDCERLAALIGKRRWFDPRYWHFAKQAVALDALPILARHTAAVIGARLGLSRKCLVLDLDNTLWGGIVGEDGLDGIRLGDTPEGEAFQAFQESILALQRRGIVLAVCSKNNEADAREVFDRHSAMRIALDDVAVFVADWRPKPEQLRTVAETLGIGLDALVFVDDNPAEREAVRQFLPEIDVIPLPLDPSEYVEALADYLLFEPASFTADDERRTEQYRGRRQAAAAASSADSIEDFYRSLEMRTDVSPFTEADLPRIAQLLGKTSQFNLTTRRHSAAALEAFARDPDCVHMSFRLSDRFTDHGLVALVIGFERGGILDVDTWLMSCRVIGRTLEESVLQELCRAAVDQGCATLEGTYVPSPKNELVRDLYRRLGFDQLDENEGTTRWRYDLAVSGAVVNDFIQITRGQGDGRGGA